MQIVGMSEPRGGGAGGFWPTQILVDELNCGHQEFNFPNLLPRPSHGSGLESIPDVTAIVAPAGIKFWSFKLSIQLLFGFHYI